MISYYNSTYEIEMYLTLGIVTLLFIFFIKKSRAKYRARYYKPAKICHGALLLIINVLFECIYRLFFVSQHEIGASVFVAYWLPQIIYYLFLITVLLALSSIYGLFIWPDVKNAINEKRSSMISLIFWLFILCIFYPSIVRLGIEEASLYMHAIILITDVMVSICLVRILVIKFNK